MSELIELVRDTPDVIEFLRRQAYANSSAAAGRDQSDVERVEDAERVSTGARPKSKPPLNVDALDCADAEAAVLFRWAEFLGIPHRGWVWRVQGVPRGVLYGDLTAVRDIRAWLLGAVGFVAPEGFAGEVRSVRNVNRMLWPELDVFLSSEQDFVVRRDAEPALF